MENESMSSKKSCIQIYRLVEAVFPAASSLRRRIFIGATHPWGLGTPLTLKFLVGEFVHLSSLFELLYFIRSLRHHIQNIQGAPSTNTHYLGVRTPNTNTHFSGGPSTKYKYTLFRGSKNQIKIHIFQGVQHQIQVHIIQGVRAPNENTHYSGDPSTKYKYTFFRGSEHQIGGRPFPLELHLVHFNSKYGEIGENKAIFNFFMSF